MAESAQIDKVSPRHEAILNCLIMNPTMSRAEMARQFGVSQSWLSVVINSDVFQAKLRERQDEVFSVATETITSKLTRLAELSLDRLTDIIPVERDVTNLRDAAKLALEGLGFHRAQAPLAPAGGQGNTFNFYGVDPALLAEARSRIVSRGRILEGQIVDAAETHSPAPQEL
jgi:hypothetical protein